MILAVEVVDREAAGDPLLVVGLGAGRCVRLAGLVLALGAGHELDARQRQQIAQLGGVEEVGGDQHPLAAGLAVANGDRPDAVALDVGTDRLVLEKYLQAAARTVRCEQVRQNRQGDPWFVAKLRHVAIAGVEVTAGSCLGGQGVMAAIVIADSLPQCPVRRTRAKLLDPGMLVGRDGLRRELAADPVGRFGQDDRAAGPQSGQGGRAASQAAADDHDIGTDLRSVTHRWRARRGGASLGCQQRSQAKPTISREIVGAA